MHQHSGYHVDFEFARVRQELMREARQQERLARQAAAALPNGPGRLAIVLRTVREHLTLWRRTAPAQSVSHATTSPAA